MWNELQRLRAELDKEQKERRASSFMERVHVAQLRQQTEMLRRSLLAPPGTQGAPVLQPVLPAAQPPYATVAGAMHGAPVQPPLTADGERKRQQTLFSGMAELHQRLQGERARNAGFATELRCFARNMDLEAHLDPDDRLMQLDQRVESTKENSRENSDEIGREEKRRTSSMSSQPLFNSTSSQRLTSSTSSQRLTTSTRLLPPSVAPSPMRVSRIPQPTTRRPQVKLRGEAAKARHVSRMSKDT